MHGRVWCIDIHINLKNKPKQGLGKQIFSKSIL